MKLRGSSGESLVKKSTSLELSIQFQLNSKKPRSQIKLPKRVSRHPGEELPLLLFPILSSPLSLPTRLGLEEGKRPEVRGKEGRVTPRREKSPSQEKGSELKNVGFDSLSSQATLLNKSGTGGTFTRRYSPPVNPLPSPGKDTSWEVERWLSLLYSQPPSGKLGSEARGSVPAPKPQKNGTLPPTGRLGSRGLRQEEAQQTRVLIYPQSFSKRDSGSCFGRSLRLPPLPKESNQESLGRRGIILLQKVSVDSSRCLHRGVNYYSLPDENSFPSQTLSCQLSLPLKGRDRIFDSFSFSRSKTIEEIFASSFGSEATLSDKPSQKTWLGSEVNMNCIT